MNNPPPLHVTHTTNPLGRDFIVGDIHGCFSKLTAALREIHFKPATDRLFSVGDLIDRGPHSRAVLGWLEKSWFFPVLGNHEEFCFLSRSDPASRAYHVRHGGEWFTSLSDAAVQPYLDAFARLPLTREIETSLGPVGIVHADPPGDSWAEVKANLAAPPPLGSAARDIALWSASRMKNPKGFASLPDAHQIIVGHCPVKTPTLVGNVLHIDTGGWMKDGKTDRSFYLYEVPK